MTNYPRQISPNLLHDCFRGKVLILTGARQVGKTTLIKNLDFGIPSDQILFVNADNPTDREIFAHQDLSTLTPLVEKHKLIIIDEAQRIPDIGLTTKLLVDHYGNDKQFILTGSSTIHLLDQTSEPLTGRKFVHHLYPISYEELITHHGLLTTTRLKDPLLIYGSYPEVLSLDNSTDKTRRLQEILDSYLFRDILEFQTIKNPQILHSLLKALAWQVGSEVSYNELAGTIGIDSKTVEHYIDLLEKSFVVFRLPAFSRHRRREISKNKKVFFYDLGIRNASINNFSPISSRDDLGRLWENFCLVERLKYRSYHQINASQYFWRTYDGAEIDLVEERDGQLFGYEVKHRTSKRVTVPTKWANYPHSHYTQINPKSLSQFIH